MATQLEPGRVPSAHSETDVHVAVQSTTSAREPLDGMTAEASSSMKDVEGSEPEEGHATSVEDLEARLPGMKLHHDPKHPGRHLAPSLDHPEEADMANASDDDDDDYDSLL